MHQMEDFYYKYFLSLFIISSWASVVILVLALTLILQLINFARLLTLNYKKIGLSDDEYVLLSITYELVQTGTKFVNPSDLALLCNFSTTKIDVVYSGLISKGFIKNEFSPTGTIYTSFDGIVKSAEAGKEIEITIPEI